MVDRILLSVQKERKELDDRYVCAKCGSINVNHREKCNECGGPLISKVIVLHFTKKRRNSSAN